jgi:hypothetical protein
MVIVAVGDGDEFRWKVIHLLFLAVFENNEKPKTRATDYVLHG